MSSILDALRKLEEEKAQSYAAPETPLPIEPQTREPAPRRTRARRAGADKSSGKLWIAAAAGIFVLGVIWAAAMGGKETPPPGDIETAAAVPVTSPDGALGTRDPKLEQIEADLRDVAQASLVEVEATPTSEAFTEPIEDEIVDEPVVTDPQPAQQEQPPREPAPVAEAPIQLDVTPVASHAEPEPSPIESPIDEPDIAPEMEPIDFVEEPTPAPEPEPRIDEIAPPRQAPSENYRRVMATSEAFRGSTSLEPEPEPEVAVDIRSYPILTRTERARLDVPEFNINMLMLPNDANPNPAALINYNKVYVGENIPDTNGRVQLVGVDIRGIAVEVSGERYYYPK